MGIVQGATEFIPVSSSGHLVLVPWLLGWEPLGFTFDVIIHWGTLVGVVVYFWHDLVNIATGVLRGLAQRQPFGTWDARLGWLIVLATIPAVIVGYLFEDQFEALFARPSWVAFFLLVTGGLLWLSETLGRRVRHLESVTPLDAFLIGVAQMAAITPGISRSGATIAMALVRGLERPAAARFSFLMMIPIVFGAGLLKFIQLLQEGATGETVLLLVLGFIAAAITGYICIAFLLRFLATHSVRAFAVYTWLFGSLCLILAQFR
jgi:undecaprenyl-diphosphatase